MHWRRHRVVDGSVQQEGEEEEEEELE